MSGEWGEAWKAHLRGELMVVRVGGSGDRERADDRVVDGEFAGVMGGELHGAMHLNRRVHFLIFVTLRYKSR